jgi:hypothetical protein
MNLANILLLTPAAICLYADVVTSRARYHLHKSNLPRDRAEALALHTKAASSGSRKRAWLEAAGDSGSGGEDGGRGDNKRRPDEVDWRNFAADQVLRLPKGFPIFPTRRQCPWQMFTYTRTRFGRFGFKVAVDARTVPTEGRKGRGSRDEGRGRDDDDYRDRERGKSRNREKSRTRDKSRNRDRSRDRDRSRHGNRDRQEEYWMGEDEFLEVNRKKAMALGVYRTKCAPYEMTVYYALTDGLEGVGFSDNTAGAFEEALDGFGKLNIDF